MTSEPQWVYSRVSESEGMNKMDPKVVKELELLKQVKEFMMYNADTGAFTWIKQTGSIQVGYIAGNVNYTGYRRLVIDGKYHLAHRIAWLYTYGTFPESQIDHINGIRDDNRIDNLRAVNNSENSKNSKLRNDSTTGITGLSERRNGKSWRVYVQADGKLIGLGTHSDFFEACCIRKSAELEYNYHPNHGRAT